jgi:prepilin-type N-terminal cleavage/methylation domain-containing protein
MSTNRSAFRGVTLIELAIVLFIVGLLLTGLLGPLSTQLESRERQQTQQQLEDIKEALIGFAIANGRLPCPDDPASGDGVADPDASGACNTSEGFVPWATLGTAQGDVWGNRYRYRVTQPGFTTVDDGICLPTDDDLDLCETGTIDIKTRAAPGTEALIADDVPAVIVSHGKNGLGATSVEGNARPNPPATTDENDNRDANTDFRSRTFSTGEGDCDDTDNAKPFCAFDDIVVWISPNILKNRMVTAGRLP